MSSKTPREGVESLLMTLEGVQPVAYDLGTPQLAEPEAVQTLVGMGPAIVPALIEHLSGERSKQQLAYAAMVLGRIGDRQALVSLQELRARFQARVPKDEWDYAVIGQCNVAIAHLEPPAK